MVKIVLLGSAGVGKTNVVRSMCDIGFEKRYFATVGAEVSPSFFNGVTVSFWDIAGRQEFAGNIESHTQGASIYLLFCDLTRKSTCKAVQEHYNFVKERAPHAHFIVVGNKSDLPHEPTDEALWSPEVLAMPYFEVSAKTGEGITELMAAIQQHL